MKGTILQTLGRPNTTDLTPKYEGKRIESGGGRHTYLLVDLNANGALGDVPDTTGAAMVELVRHALVDGAIDLDVDVVADVVGPEVGREGDGTLLPEGTRERVSGT